MLTFRNTLLYGCGSPLGSGLPIAAVLQMGKCKTGNGQAVCLLAHAEEGESEILQCFKREMVVQLPTPLPRDGGLLLDCWHASVQDAPWPGRARRAFIMSFPAFLHPHCLPTWLPRPQALLSTAAAQTCYSLEDPSKQRTAFRVRQTWFECRLPHLPDVGGGHLGMHPHWTDLRTSLPTSNSRRQPASTPHPSTPSAWHASAL